MVKSLSSLGRAEEVSAEYTMEGQTMKKLLLALVSTLCMVGVAQADLYTFSFDSDDSPGLANNSTAAQTETYMEGIYMGGLSPFNNITVLASDDDGKIITNALDPLGPDQWLQANTKNLPDAFRISFNNTPIISVSFEWAVMQNDFYLRADGIEFVVGYGHGNDVIHDSWSKTFDGPVTELYFHNSSSGWIGIDNLVVTPYLVPVPAAVLLGVLGLCAAGMKLRKLV